MYLHPYKENGMTEHIRNVKAQLCCVTAYKMWNAVFSFVYFTIFLLFFSFSLLNTNTDNDIYTWKFTSIKIYFYLV
jgi:hypothetical protein